jgi:hypothetical protein
VFELALFLESKVDFIISKSACQQQIVKKILIRQKLAKILLIWVKNSMIMNTRIDGLWPHFFFQLGGDENAKVLTRIRHNRDDSLARGHEPRPRLCFSQPKQLFVHSKGWGYVSFWSRLGHHDPRDLFLGGNWVHNFQVSSRFLHNQICGGSISDLDWLQVTKGQTGKKLT